MKKIFTVLISFLLVSSMVFAIDLSNLPRPVLNNGNDASPDSIFSLFSLVPSQTSYASTDIVTLKYSTTSWQLSCKNTYAVIETYSMGNPNSAITHASHNFGSINGNTKFSYTNTVPSGTLPPDDYEAVGYLWCGDSTSDFSSENYCSSASTGLCKTYNNGAIISNIDDHIKFSVTSASQSPGSVQVCNGKSYPCKDVCGNAGTQVCTNGSWSSCTTNAVCDQPNIQASTMSIQVSGSQITGGITLTNSGGNMTAPAIAELQIVSASESASIGSQFYSSLPIPVTQQVCDSSKPNNVHQSFQLGSGQSVTLNFVSPTLSPETYHAAFFLAGGCSPGNTVVPGQPAVIPLGITSSLKIQTGGAGNAPNTGQNATSSPIGIDPINLESGTGPYPSGKPLSITFNIYNSVSKAGAALAPYLGIAGTYAEAGIYTDTPYMRQRIVGTTDLSNPFSVYYQPQAGASLVDNCGGSAEEFVQTIKTSNLLPDERRTYTLSPLVPGPNSKLKDGTSNYNPDGKYFVVVNLFNACGTAATKVGYGKYAGVQNSRFELITATSNTVPSYLACHGCVAIYGYDNNGTCDNTKYTCVTNTNQCAALPVCTGITTQGGTSPDNSQTTACAKPISTSTRLYLDIFGTGNNYAYCGQSKTRSEFASESPSQVQSSYCQEVGNCIPRDGYTISCVNANSAGVQNDATAGGLSDFAQSIFGASNSQLTFCLATSNNPLSLDAVYHSIAGIFGVDDATGQWILWGGIIGIVILIAISRRRS